MVPSDSYGYLHYNKSFLRLLSFYLTYHSYCGKSMASVVVTVLLLHLSH